MYFDFFTRYSTGNTVHEDALQKIEEQALRQTEMQLQEKEIELQKRKLENEELKRAQDLKLAKLKMEIEKLKRDHDFENRKKEIEVELWKKTKELELRKQESEIEHKVWMRNKDAEIEFRKLEMSNARLEECMKQTMRRTTNTKSGYFSSTTEVKEELINPLCKDVSNVNEKLMLGYESKENLKLEAGKQRKQSDKDEL